jgi:hypothetical protein
MNKKIALLASLLTAFVGVAQAQTTGCTCDTSAARTADATALTSLLSNKMVCASVGGEAWQEWHNGSSSGPLVDYKRGPGDRSDPSSPVGTYTVNSNNTVTYNYAGGGGSYTYDVCLVSTSNTYTFCGASHGGRNITGARVGGSGLTACASVSNAVLPTTPGGRVRKP